MVPNLHLLSFLKLFMAHVYVIVPWLTLLFSFNKSSHFLVFTSLMMCIYRQLSLPLLPFVCYAKHTKLL